MSPCHCRFLTTSVESATDMDMASFRTSTSTSIIEGVSVRFRTSFQHPMISTVRVNSSSAFLKTASALPQSAKTTLSLTISPSPWHSQTPPTPCSSNHRSCSYVGLLVGSLITTLVSMSLRTIISPDDSLSKTPPRDSRKATSTYLASFAATIGSPTCLEGEGEGRGIQTTLDATKSYTLVL